MSRASARIAPTAATSSSTGQAAANSQQQALSCTRAVSLTELLEQYEAPPISTNPRWALTTSNSNGRQAAARAAAQTSVAPGGSNETDAVSLVLEMPPGAMCCALCCGGERTSRCSWCCRCCRDDHEAPGELVRILRDLAYAIDKLMLQFVRGGGVTSADEPEPGGCCSHCSAIVATLLCFASLLALGGIAASCGCLVHP